MAIVPSSRSRFYRVLTAAVADITTHGFDSERRLEHWMRELRQAAIESMIPEARLARELEESLGRVFRRVTSASALRLKHRGIQAYRLEQVRPHLRSELDRRILASANLIKLNREQALAETLRRFAGWSTSIPAGGTEVAKREKVRKDVRKSLAGLPFVERRVIIDQGHKLSAAVSNIIATDGGAIAIVWHSHWREIGYDYRPSHRERDEKVYGLRDSWAEKAGYVKRGEDGWYDEITAVGEEVFCRCYGTYVYSLGELVKIAPRMLTDKGREKLVEISKQMASFSGAMIHA